EVQNGELRAMPMSATTCGMTGYELSESKQLWGDLEKQIGVAVGGPVSPGGSIRTLTSGEILLPLAKSALDALISWFGHALLGWVHGWFSSDQQDNDFALQVVWSNPLIVKGA